MKKGLHRFFSLFLALIMMISIMPAFEMEAFAGTTISFNEYYSTGSRKIAGVSTGGVFKLTATNGSGTNGSANFSDCILETSPETNGSYHYKMYNDKKSITFKSDDGQIEFYASIVYEDKHQGEFKYIKKIDSLKIPPGRRFSTSFIERTYFKRNPSNNKIVSSNTIITQAKTYTSSRVVTVSTVSTNVNGSAVTIPKGTNLNVTSISSDGKKGLVNYSGKNIWVNLSYLNYVAPAVSKPPAPTVTLKTSTDIPIGEQMTIEWNSVTDAKYYTAAMYDSSGNQIKAYNNIYGNSATFVTEAPGTYSFKVTGFNSQYTGDTGTSAQKVTVHSDSTVTYLDSDGTTVIGTQKVSYGFNSTSPLPPEKEGYTFKSWNGGTNGIKNDTTLVAEYTVNQYTVQFIDADGNIIDSQKVKYHEDAIPPEVTTAPTNYEFAGWSSDDYKNVYTINKNEPIKVYAVYTWKNKDLPISCEITSASRQTDGYYVNFKLTNYPNAVTRGRAVVCLKTAEGKLVQSTESAAFSIPESSTETMKVFVPCENAATVAEVLIVDSYLTGVPISHIASTNNIEKSLMWSKWSVDEPEDNGDNEIESRTEYRFRNKRTATGSTKTKEGWTYSGTYSSSVGSWSAWQDAIINSYSYEDKKREVQSQTVNVWANKTKHNYYHWHSYSYNRNNSYKHDSTYYDHYISLDWALSYKSTGSTGINWYGTYSCPACGHSNYWIPNGTSTESYVSGTKNQYRYRDTYYTYNFYRWDNNDWSDWSADSVSATSSRQVDTRTTYRYKSTSAGIEDNSGVERTYTGNIGAEYAGKQITLYVYKADEASDYSNEYVGQTIVGDDGSYTFIYKLREEPSIKTGDMNIAIALEGTTNMTVVDTIVAPKPKYTVTYYGYDKDGNEIIISQQEVEEGKSAVVPEQNPEREGYTFVCWNNTCTNIRSDMEVRPVYVEKTYSVIIIDFRTNVTIKKEYHHGDPIPTPDLNDCDSGIAKGWDVVLLDKEKNENDDNIIKKDNAVVLLNDDETADSVTSQDAAEESIVEEATDVDVINGGVAATSDMVISAVYDTKTYNVDFYDYEGNVVDSQTVEYDGSVEAPELPQSDGVEYYDWDISEEDLMGIKENIAVIPEYTFDETTPNPTAGVTTGAYDDTQTVTLSCDDENAIIYYTTDGTDPTENIDAMVYSEPLTISNTTTLSFYAESFNKNASDVVNEYYVIGDNGKIVTVHDTLDDIESETRIVNSISEITYNDYNYNEGYTLEGFYTDEECTVAASTNDADYSSVVDLYAKYNINMYTVGFYDETQSENHPLKEVTVEYGSSVEPPIVEDKTDMVFVGWEGGDYKFIEGDTRLVAVFKNPSEIVTINLDKTNYSIEDGNSFKINATIDNSDNLELIWLSSNEDVAIVSDDGTVTAVGAGDAIIYAITDDDSAIAECKVTVEKSINKSICLKELSTLRLDSNGNLRNLPIDGSNTVDYVRSQLKNNYSSLIFTNINNKTIESTDLVGTGTIITLVNNDVTVDTMAIALTGDITGDGLINNRDVAYAARVMIKKQNASEIQLTAIDVNGDGKVNNRDVAMLSRYLVGKESIVLK